MEVKNALINKITNILGIVVALGTVVLDAMGTVPEGSEWYTYAGAVVVAVILFFTGKKKTPKLNG